MIYELIKLIIAYILGIITAWVMFVYEARKGRLKLKWEI